MSRQLFATFAVTFFVWAFSAQAGSLDMTLSPACAKWLTPRWNQNQNMISQTVIGDGKAYLMTPTEFTAALGLAPHTQLRIQDYVNSQRHHRAAFVLLSEGASPLGKTLASTYPDNPTRYLAFTTGHEWLASNLPQFSDEIPQHLVIMSHGSDSFSALHEIIHLEDFDAIYDYASAKGGAYLLRMDIFTILSEIHAYQSQFRMIRTETSTSGASAAEGLSRDLQNQVGPAFAKLDEKTRFEIQKIVGLAGQDLGDYVAFLTSANDFRPWPQILPRLSSELFREYLP